MAEKMAWISVRKEKPPLDTEILIAQKFKFGYHIRIAEYVEVPGRKIPKFGTAIQRDENGEVYQGYPHENVTHWMLLPALPKYHHPQS